MKLHGQDVAPDYSQQIELPRPGGQSVRLSIKPLPLGFHRRIHAHGILPPTPPQRVARDSSGKPLRDERGEVLLRTDANDRDFRAAQELHNQRLAVLMAVEGLRDDPTIEFESTPPADGADWCRYADALYAEFEQAGFSAGDLLMICQQVCLLSNLIDEHLRDASARFFSTRREEETAI